MNISSREFLKQAEFINVESLTRSDDASASNSGSGNSGSGNSGGGHNDDDDIITD